MIKLYFTGMQGEQEKRGGDISKMCRIKSQF